MDCIIGLLYHNDYSELVTLDRLKEHIEEQREYNRSLAVDPIFSTAPDLKVKCYTLQQYCDWRRSTDLHRFSYCPDCGAKIDWGKIKREAARPPP